jgi:hypothetical protein
MQDHPEDESILSAYLDDELDENSRRRVESMLAADPRLAETLGQLAGVTDLIGNLPRPSPEDISAEVMTRIRNLPERRQYARRGAPWLDVRHPWQILGVAVGIAASIAIGLIPLLSRKPPNHLVIDEQPAVPRVSIPRSAVVDGRGFSIAHLPSGGADGNLPPQESVTPPVSDSNLLTEKDKAARQSILQTASGAAGAEQTTDESVPTRLRKLLDHPELRHVFLVTDKVSGGDPARIADLIDQSARSDYYSMTIAQGIVIDPEHPGRATVYAVAIDESELDNFRSRLKAAYGGRNVETEPKPEVLAQLSEIEQVEAHSPPAVGEIVIPHSDVAIKANPAEPAAASESIRLVDGSFTSAHQASGASSSRSRGRRSADSKPKTNHETASESTKSRSQDTLLNASQSKEPPDPGRPNKPSSREIVVLVWIRSPASG